MTPLPTVQTPVGPDPAFLHPDPPYDYPNYRSTRLRAPRQPLVTADPDTVALTAPVYGHRSVRSEEADLTAGFPGEPLGERMVLRGRVLDSDGRPVAGQLVEIWQANACGRYAHPVDQHPAPLDPNFLGAGRCLTDSEGRYRFLTIKPGAYPWRNHSNAWRPAHIHFSLFGAGLTSRLVTQMYFPGDPLFSRDPIFQSIPDPRARERLLAAFDWETTEPEWALGFRWDVVLRGSAATPFEAASESAP
jgi:protocatechuate 3,4-dioxygenase beta subunit